MDEVKKRALLLLLLVFTVMAPTTGGGPGGTPQTNCDTAATDKVLYSTATGLWSCGVDQGGGATWGFGLIADGVATATAEVGGDTLNVTDTGSINFTASNGPPDDLTAIATCGGIISCPVGSAITTSISANRMLGRDADSPGGVGVVEQLTPDASMYIFADAFGVDDTVVLTYPTQDISGNGTIDASDYSNATAGIDKDNDLLLEMECNTGGAGACYFDPDESGTSDFDIFATAVLSYRAQIRSADGIGVGLPTGDSATGPNSACIGRDTGTSVDRLFEDKDCDFATTTTAEVATASTTNAEAFLTDMQRRLSADVSTDGAGAANDTTGIQATDLKIDLDWVGAYWIEYQILSQTSSAAVGIKYGVEYTGTETSLYCQRTHLSNSTTAADDTADDTTTAGGVAQVVEGYGAIAASTTAPNMGPNVGGYTTTNTTLERISCNLLTTTAGDLTLHFASEVDGTAVTVKANSMVRATPFP